MWLKWLFLGFYLLNPTQDMKHEAQLFFLEILCSPNSFGNKSKAPNTSVCVGVLLLKCWERECSKQGMKVRSVSRLNESTVNGSKTSIFFGLPYLFLSPERILKVWNPDCGLLSLLIRIEWKVPGGGLAVLEGWKGGVRVVVGFFHGLTSDSFLILSSPDLLALLWLLSRPSELHKHAAAEGNNDRAFRGCSIALSCNLD